MWKQVKVNWINHPCLGLWLIRFAPDTYEREICGVFASLLQQFVSIFSMLYIVFSKAKWASLVLLTCLDFVRGKKNPVYLSVTAKCPICNYVRVRKSSEQSRHQIKTWTFYPRKSESLFFFALRLCILFVMKTCNQKNCKERRFIETGSAELNSCGFLERSQQTYYNFR